MPEEASRPRPEDTARRPPGRFPLPIMAVFAAMLSATAASASDTHLLDVYLGSFRSDQVRSLKTGSLELAGGEEVRFDEWYSPDFPDLTVLLLTELSGDLGLIWGVSIGERGEKYQIDPTIHLGLAWQLRLSQKATLSASLHTLIGGQLRERSCSADYGTFGVSEVNCRLAASLLPPEETLDYMLDMPGWKETRLSIRFQLVF